MKSRRVESRTCPSNRDGFVLVSVLWILAILTVVSLGFARRAMLERQIAWYTLDREQAQQMARGAAERGLFELANKGLLDEFNHQTGYTALGQRWAMRTDLFKESSYFHESGNALRGDTCVYMIEDCESRFSINDVPRNVLEQFDALNSKTIDEILDRREIESSGYQDRRFLSPEQLHTIQEFSEEEWYGSEDEAGLRDLLGVWGDGNRGLINLNTASAGVLLALPDIDPEVVEAVVTYRSGADGVLGTSDDQAFELIGDVNQKLKVSSEKLTPLRRYCKTNSEYFTIRAHATRRRGKIAAFCTVVVHLEGTTASILEWREQAHGA